MNLEKVRKYLYECFHNPADKKAQFINGAITFLILISIAVIPLHLISHWNGLEWMDSTLVLFDKIIVTIFTIEYLLRIWSSKNPRNFILSWEGIIDLFSILPFYFDRFGILKESEFAFETFLLMRIVRVLRFTTMYGIEQEALSKCEKNTKFYKIPGEKVERVVQKHPLIFVVGMILPLIFMSFSLLMLIFAKESTQWTGVWIGVSVLFSSLSLLFFIKAWLDYNYDVIYITSHRVILQNHELFGSETNGLMYDAITNVIPDNRGFWRWALGLGHIIIETANRDGTIVFEKVRHPHKVIKKITENRVKARQRLAKIQAGKADPIYNFSKENNQNKKEIRF